MTGDQLIVLAVLLVTFALFLRGTWRYDVVAMGALITLVLLRVTPAGGAFAGFGHPAVVTVAAVLVWTRGLQNSGVVDILAGWLLRAGERTTPQVAASTTLVAASSAFMNNVGALALFLPVTLRIARQRQISPSVLLMPLSFASLLGGLVTLVGTPPNIIIAIERGRVSGEAFRMFDFAPVGGTVAIVGVIFIALVGWRLIPQREGAGDQQPLFEISEYLTEVRVTKDSQFAAPRSPRCARRASMRWSPESSVASGACPRRQRGNRFSPTTSCCCARTPRRCRSCWKAPASSPRATKR